MTLSGDLQKAREVATDLYDVLVKQGKFTEVRQES